MSVSSIRLVLVAFAVLMLTGCVVGQKIRLDNTPQVTGNVGAGYRASVYVEDRREAVVSGKHQPWRIGQYRAAAGIPWSVTTEGKRPLADQIRADLEEELVSLGFELGTGAARLEVLISSWEFTGYQNGHFRCSLHVSVKGPGGDVRFTQRLVRDLDIKGTLLLGARGGFERDMPGIYGKIIESMARQNQAVLNAIKQNE